MSYWLYITTFDNWQISKNIQIIGLKEKFIKKPIKIFVGSNVLAYIKTQTGENHIYDSYIDAEFLIDSNVYIDNNDVFSNKNLEFKESFPVRYHIANIASSSEKKAFRNIIEELSFIKNKKSWGANLLGKSLLSISKLDYDVLKNYYFNR